MSAIQTLLIANRGEIACRIIRTAKQLGIKTIAIYAESEENALHCQYADLAICVGPVPVQKSYLNIDNIIKIAKENAADAIHPGYGFLSENAAFSQKCLDENIIFVGPKPLAIAQMGAKDEAKKIMQKAGVPIVPGYMGQDQSDEAFIHAAKQIGYPVMLKAAKGGGGKGMRIVYHAQDLKDAIAASKRESLSSFGDASLLIEKYLQNSRHIEVQIFRDSQGNAVHLYERDCSLQRRHQKIIEESPALGISADIKTKLYQAAVNAAHAIDYLGAGTIEFLYADEQFYFMEMNTRLQVEHPVTEMITGIDLVQWQLRIASGEALPLKQQDIKNQGHAIEARIYAEDPYHNFLPVTGVIKKIFVPTHGAYRLDSGIQEGDKISIYFDPLLAKMIVHGTNRVDALVAMQNVLQHYHILGITTNLPFLRNILKQQSFRDDQIDTQYLESIIPQLQTATLQPPSECLAIASLVYLLKRQAEQNVINENEPYSPWNNQSAFRINLPFEENLTLHHQQEIINIIVGHQANVLGQYIINIPSKNVELNIKGEILNNQVHYHLSNQSGSIDFYYLEDVLVVFYAGESYFFKCNDFVENQDLSIMDHRLLAPMPGIISKLWVQAGDNVTIGTKLLALEAMKMEHTLSAPKSGQIKSILYQVGDQVEEGCELIDFE